MYNPHFGLSEAPFKITPNTNFFFQGGNRGATLEALSYAIKEGEGIIKVVGEVGSGKTMICRMLQSTLPESIETVYLAIPSVAPEHVLKAIAYELQMRLPKNADRLTLLQKLQNYLLKRHAKGQQTVLFVEEAQAMPIATLEEIRLLSNLETNEDKLLQIVLFGQPELDVNLAAENIRQLRDRITHSFELGPFEADEIGEYLTFRLRAAGYHGAPLFGDKSISKIAVASEGLLRRVNILADKSLLSAFSENTFQVKPKHVKAAIEDSEFASNPSHSKWLIIFAIAGGLLLILGLLSKLSPEKNESTAVSGQVSAISSQTIEQDETIRLAKKAKVKAATTAPVSYDIDKQIYYSEAMLKYDLPDKNITIQLMTADNIKDANRAMAKLVKELALPSLFVFKKPAPSNKVMVFYGNYADLSSATTAQSLLPKSIKKYAPVVRSFRKVRMTVQPKQ